MDLKPIWIEGRDINDVWHQILYTLLEKGRPYHKSSGSRVNLESKESDMLGFDFLAGYIHYPHTENLAPTMPEGSGLVPPTTDEAIKEYFVNNLMNPKLDSHKQHYKYSQWIVGGNERSHLKQLDWIIEHFKKHGYTNKHCHIDVRDPEIKKVYDTPYMRCPSCGRYYNHGHTYCVSCKVKLYIDEYERGSTPCLTGLTFRIIDNLLCLHINYRSWDLYGGFPENMGGFALLNQFIAEQLPGVLPGPLAFACIGADCHMSYLKLLKQRLRKE